MFFFNKVLYVVGLPIGNIFDFSCRSIFILKNVDFIVAEDSRKIGFLTKFFFFKNKIVVLNPFNEKHITNDIIYKINNGFSAALVSDCGTPCLSDPGNFFINEAYLNKIKIIPIPGASVLSTVLSLCKFNTSKFLFEGFLPKKKIYKEIIFKKLFYEDKTCIFFVSSIELLESLLLMKSIFLHDREIFIAKDLTKKFEFTFYFNLNNFDFNDLILDKFFFKGEFVILLNSFNSKSLIKFNFDTFNSINFLLNDKFFSYVLSVSFLEFRSLIFLLF